MLAIFEKYIDLEQLQMFFTAFESWAPGVVRHYSKSKKKANLYTQKTKNLKGGET